MSAGRSQARPQRVPLGARDERVCAVSKTCGSLPCGGTLCTGVPCGTGVTTPGAPGASSTVNARCTLAATPGFELVADRARQLQHRAALGRGAQEAFVGDALLVEGQHVGDARRTRRGARSSDRRSPRVVQPPQRPRRVRRAPSAGASGRRRSMRARKPGVRVDAVARAPAAPAGCSTAGRLGAPSQQPQRVERCGSSVIAQAPPSHVELEAAVLGRVRVVVEPRDLEPRHR